MRYEDLPLWELKRKIKDLEEKITRYKASIEYEKNNASKFAEQAKEKKALLDKIENRLNKAVEFLTNDLQEITSAISQLEQEKATLTNEIATKKIQDKRNNAQRESKKFKNLKKQIKAQAKDKTGILAQSAEKDKEIENLKEQIRAFSIEIEQEFSKLQNLENTKTK